MASFFIMLGVVLLLLAQHPFVTYPLSLLPIVRWHPRPVRHDAVPNAAPRSVALCLSAYNERSVIRGKVENMLAMRRAVPDLEILIYVDGATDGTVEILREFGDAITVVVGTTRQGKTFGMNSLIARTQADVLVFTDANTEFVENTIPNLLKPFADPDVGCVCGHLIYTSVVGGATAETGALYWRLEEAIKEMESRTGSAMGADGSIFAIRRSLHRPPPPDFFDDLYVSLSILCDGHRIVRASDARAYEEATSVSSEEFTRKIRIGCMSFNVHRSLSAGLRRLGPLDRYKYVSHRQLRWVCAYLLGGGLVSLVLGLMLLEAWGLLALGAAVFGLFVLAARIWPHSLARRMWEILSAIVATGIGVWRSMRGFRYQTWNPVSSARRPAA